jgi:glycosyltransferase involved in cell wall biosynthesis
MPLFARVTPDVFALHHFLRLVDHPRFLRYLLQSRQPDVVMVSNSELGYGLLPYLRASAPGATFVDFAHMEEEYWKSGGYPAMAVAAQECLDLNITSSEHLHDWMVARGGDPQRTFVCHTGVAVPPAADVASGRWDTRARLGIPEPTPVILYAGRICAQKQPAVFANTMLQLAARGGEWIALVAGDGPDAAELKAFVSRHRLTDRVRLLGSMAPAEMQQLMAACDLFFLPSKWEGIAFVVFEAMANGRAVVTADVGGQRELVTADCGVLIDASVAPEAQAERYAAILFDALQDRERLGRMGSAGRQKIEAGFRLEDMTDRLVAAFELASRFQRTAPRGAVTEGVARHCANYVIENVRLQQLADGLWLRANGGQASAVVVPRKRRTPWQTGALLVAAKLEPAYAWGLKRGWTWLPPIRQRLRESVLGS